MAIDWSKGTLSYWIGCKNCGHWFFAFASTTDRKDRVKSSNCPDCGKEHRIRVNLRPWWHPGQILFRFRWWLWRKFHWRWLILKKFNWDFEKGKQKD